MDSYYLEWFDLLVTVTLNPKRTQISGLENKQVELVMNAIGEQRNYVQTLLKRAIYKRKSRKSIELLLRRFYSDLIMLYDQAHENSHLIEPGEVQSILAEVIRNLEELLFTIERRYGDFLGLDERVPRIYLLNTREDIAARLKVLNSELFTRVADKRLTGMILETLHDFIRGSELRVTFREMIYKKELVRSLEEIIPVQQETKLYKSLIEVLVYLNFNKKSFLNYLTNMTAQRANAFDLVSERLDAILLAYKEFNQMHRKPGISLNPNYVEMHTVLGNWFVQEISYLEKKFQFEVAPLNISGQHSSASPAPKATLAMNADQIAVLIRALVDSGKLVDRSVNQVFKAVVPMVSSKKRDNLSWESMRKRSYTPEEKDKKAVIDLLKDMERIVENY